MLKATQRINAIDAGGVLFLASKYHSIQSEDIKYVWYLSQF